MVRADVDVIIPVYHPRKEFEQLLKHLQKQKHSINRIIIMNTEEEYWDPKWEDICPGTEVHHLAKKDFDHGGTRKRAAELSDAEFMVFMTQDALPADTELISNLLKPMYENEIVGAAYARQIARKDADCIERRTRLFNYPKESVIRTEQDIPRYGIKTFFCSNVCAAYRKSLYLSLGGFAEKTIFNEDMIYAGGVIHAGYAVAYAADARVIHSHNYSCKAQFHRNFDLGVSQAEHPEVFEGVPSEGEGIRMVKETVSYLLQNKKLYLIPGYILKSGCKYAGYLLGKNYKRLPRKLILICTMNRDYWS